jgi:hypothetical protein
MTEIGRIGYFRFIAHPEFVDQFRLGAPHESKHIDSHRNLTSFSRVSGFIDNMTSYPYGMTSRWFRNIKPRRNPFINNIYDFLTIKKFSGIYCENRNKSELRRTVGTQAFVARRPDMDLKHIHMRSLQAGAGLHCSTNP